MPSYVTPKKNTEYIFYVSLVFQSDTKTMQSNPTIAAGDFKVATDGGALGNLTTLPVVTPASSKMVKVTLSASEMNGDNITFVASDAAGSEWCDLTINIQTTATQIDNLVRSTTPANTLDVDVNNRAEALLGATTHTGAVIPTVTTLTGHTVQTGDSFGRIGAAGASLTDLGGMSTGMKAEVEAEATDALNAYDPPTRAEATADKDAILAVLDEATILVRTTIATLASQTSFTLTAGSADNSAYVGAMAVITDVSTATQKAIGLISAYTGATKTITLVADPGIFTMAATDKITILSVPKSLPAALADGAGGLPISDAGGLDLDAKLAATDEVTAARMGALTDWIDGGRLDLLLDAVSTHAAADVDTTLTASHGAGAWTTGAGGSDRLLMVDTTIATLASQTSFTLAAGSADNNAYLNCTIVIEDVSTATQKAVGLISGYVGATKTVTLKYDPGIFTMAVTDKVYVLAENALKSTEQNRQLDVTVNGNGGIDWGNVENPTTAVDLSGTDIQLANTITTYTGNTVQTGDSFARIGAAGAGLSNINLPNQTMDITGNITGNLSGSVGSVTGAVGSVTGAVGLVTGAVGSVTGNVDGNVTGSVGSVVGHTVQTADHTASITTLDGKLPAALVSGRMDSDAKAINSNASAASKLAQSADTIETGAAIAGTLSTTQMTTNLTEATDDHFNGRIIIWTSGVLANQATHIEDYDGATKKLTYTAITEAPTATDTFVIV